MSLMYNCNEDRMKKMSSKIWNNNPKIHCMGGKYRLVTQYPPTLHATQPQFHYYF